MLKLFIVRFFWRDNVGSLQPVIVSERTKAAAIKRARAFVATTYRERVVLDHAHEVCTTPDDVLDWT